MKSTEKPDTSGRGSLRIIARTGDNAWPVPGATVTVTDEEAGTELRATLTTDESGRTEAITLPAPAKSSSLSPGADRPYAIYRVYIEAAGYYPNENRRVPVFDGILSLQPAEMIPLSRFDPQNTVPEGNTEFTSLQALDAGGED